MIPTSIITDAYNEIVTWRKNVFLVPYGKIGREFIDQVTLHINEWNSSSNNQHISLKAAFVLLAVALQKPSPKSKTKDHQEVLSKRLTLWKEGEISKLVGEGRILQRRIGKLRTSDPPEKSKVFAKLVLEGQINSALSFLSETSTGGVLELTDDVMAQLKEKHPNPQPTTSLPDIQDLLEPLENAISKVLIPAITEHRSSQLHRDILALPVHLGGLGMTNPCLEANFEQSSSVKVTTPLVQQIVAQSHQMPDDSLVKPLQQAVRSERAKALQDRVVHIREVAPQKVQRALDLAAEKR